MINLMKVYNRLRGSAEVEISGVYPQNCLNAFALGNISFWSLHKQDDTQYRLYIPLTALKKAGALAEKQKCELRVLQKAGVPPFAYRFKKRYALLAGLGVFVVFIMIMGQFIWEFTIEGNERVPDEVILQALARMGVKEGTFTRSINEDEIQNNMLLEIEDFLWFAINISGGHATVLVRERSLNEPVVPMDRPCQVVASEPGLILRLDTLRGAPVVQNGSVVEKGQVLISAEILSEKTEPRPVHAMGYAKARTWQDISAVMPEKIEKKTYTGAVRTRHALVFWGKRVNFYKEGYQPFENCDKINSETVLRVPLGVSFPIRFITETFYEYETFLEYQTEENAADCLSRCLTNILSQGGGEVTDLQMAYENRNGLLGIRMTAEVVKDIALTEYLP